MSEIMKVRVGPMWYKVEIDDINTDPVKVKVNEKEFEITLHDKPGLQSHMSSVEDPMEDSQDSETDRPAKPDGISKKPARLFKSPMPGTILSISVEIGDSVSPGDEVCLLESMKMRQVLRSDIGGKVCSILVVPGESILDRAPILELLDE